LFLFFLTIPINTCLSGCQRLIFSQFTSPNAEQRNTPEKSRTAAEYPLCQQPVSGHSGRKLNNKLPGIPGEV
jgi:hypothetical protein